MGNSLRFYSSKQEHTLAKSAVQIVTAWVALSLIWGATWLAIKVGLADLPPLSFAALRFTIGAVCLFGVCAARRVSLRPRCVRDYWFFALTGFLTFTINYGLLFWGEQRVSSGLAAILQATIPGFAMVFAHFLIPCEPLQVHRILGIILALAGVTLISSNLLGFQGTNVFRGAIALTIGAASTALANVLIKSRPTRFDPAMMAAWQMVFGAVPLGLAGMFWEGNPASFHWTTTAAACLFYLAVIGSCIAFCLFYWLINRISVTKLQAIPLVTPIFAVLLGWLAYGERLSTIMLVGSSVLLSGMGLIIVRRSSQTTTTPKPAVRTSLIHSSSKPAFHLQPSRH